MKGININKSYGNFADWVEILNLEWHQHRITGSIVMAILLNGWVLPVGGVALSGRDCVAQGLKLVA